MKKLGELWYRLMVMSNAALALANLFAWLVADDNYSAFLALFQGTVAVVLYLQHHPAPKPIDARLFNT